MYFSVLASLCVGSKSGVCFAGRRVYVSFRYIIQSDMLVVVNVFKSLQKNFDNVVLGA